MKCMHCLENFHDNEGFINIGEDADQYWALSVFLCSACNRYNLFLNNYVSANPRSGTYVNKKGGYPIRPKGATRIPCPPEVPSAIAEDYNESCLVLADSPKASAALSRRCLQNVLRHKAAVKNADLSNEIEQVINSGQLPTYLSSMIDAVRNIGNFAAHPIKSQTTGAVLPVEIGEAEWNLDVLEGLFDFYYVQPAVIDKKKAALNAKLAEAGKPAMK